MSYFERFANLVSKKKARVFNVKYQNCSWERALAVLGMPPAVLRVDRRVVRHDRGADTGDGAADGHSAEEGRCL